jgi:CheY-like chemotaxis protein/two-component sensor histidine kinase
MLAGGVAHDFNNLLVAILGQTSLALYQLPVTNPARRPIEKAVHASERAADLTRQLLAYSGRGKFVVHAINLNELVQENIHLFNVVIPKHITLRLEMSPTLYPIEADTGQMQQIVMNLLLNAVQAIADKAGSVTIVTSMQHITETDSRYWQHTSQALAPGHYVTLEVHDTGYGMAEVVKSRIFDPFFTTKAEGRGLGLAAVLGIVRGHQGGIRVYSEAGQGTTFKLLFPVAQSEQLPKEDKPEIQPIPKKGVVLVIDDEAAVREAVNDILSDLGLEVIAAPNGESGLSLFQERSEEIELVLLDLSMPGLSGEDTFRALREIAPNVRVILSSGYNEAEATRRFVGKGLAGFLQKPYDINALISKVQHYL